MLIRECQNCTRLYEALPSTHNTIHMEIYQGNLCMYTLNKFINFFKQTDWLTTRFYIDPTSY